MPLLRFLDPERITSSNMSPENSPEADSNFAGQAVASENQPTVSADCTKSAEQSSSRASSGPLPWLQPAFPVSTDKELALHQAKWFQSSTTSLLDDKEWISYTRGWVMVTKSQQHSLDYYLNLKNSEMQNIDLKSSWQIALWSSVETQSKLEGATGTAWLSYDSVKQILKKKEYLSLSFRKQIWCIFKHAHCMHGGRER